MRKLLTFTVCAAILPSALGISPGIDDTNNTYLGAGVVFRKDTAGFPTQWGSGVCISDRHVLTAQHVVGNNAANKVAFQIAKSYGANTDASG